jgi:hypothetical protein
MSSGISKSFFGWLRAWRTNEACSPGPGTAINRLFRRKNSMTTFILLLLEIPDTSKKERSARSGQRAVCGEKANHKNHHTKMGEGRGGCTQQRSHTPCVRTLHVLPELRNSLRSPFPQRGNHVLGPQQVVEVQRPGWISTFVHTAEPKRCIWTRCALPVRRRPAVAGRVRGLARARLPMRRESARWSRSASRKSEGDRTTRNGRRLSRHSANLAAQRLRRRARPSRGDEHRRRRSGVFFV